MEWTDEEKQRLIELHTKYKNYAKKWSHITRELTKEFNKPYHSEQVRTYFRKSIPSEAKDRGEYFTDESKLEKRISDAELWEMKERLCQDAIEQEAQKKFHDIWFKKEEPYYICFVADQHIGAGHSNLTKMREDQELLRDTPNAFQVWGGDSIDNHIKHTAAIINADSAPSKQMRLLNYLLSIAGDKILAVVGGNHEYWTPMFCGLDYIDNFFHNWGIKFNNHRLYLSIYLSGVEYKICIFHQYRYNSTLNLGHVVKRLWDMGEWDFDVGVVCHHHAEHLETFKRHGEVKWAIRPGAYQINSGYTTLRGYNDTEPTMPGIKIFPKEKRIIGFRDLREFTDGKANN
jgi:hypothetical protein